MIPRSGRSTGEGIDYPFQYSWASLVVQLVKNLPAMWETWVPSLGWIDPLEKSIDCIVHGVAKSRTQLRFWASLVAQLVKNLPAMQETKGQSLGHEDPLGKGRAIHSSILAWRIPWTV